MKQNYSIKRQTVLDVLQSTTAHPSADAIYEECKKIVPSISLGTVYRNLQQLEQNGQIIKVATVDGKERYDADLSPHGHIICEKCGKVSDTICSQQLRNEIIEEMNNNNYSNYRITFFALCENCKINNN